MITKPSDMEIKHTVDYKQFKEVASNRDVDAGHIKKLAAAIRMKNLLPVNPIIVNQKMEVLDGQHRLAAAAQLKVPIYYIIDDGVEHGDIARLNIIKKNWKLLDFINYYTVKGVREFRELSRIINEYPNYPTTFLISLLSIDGRRQRKDIMDGHLDISNLDTAKTKISHIEDFVPVFAHAYNSRFLEAMLYIFNTGLYNHEKMIGKIQRNPGALLPCANKKQYIKLLQEIYNRGTREENITLFIKR